MRPAVRPSFVGGVPVLRTVVLALVAALALLVPTIHGQTARAAAPARPAAVRAVPNGNGVYVTFEPVADAEGYEVWRDGMRLPYTGPLPKGPSGRLQYSDDTTTRGQHYVYSVRAVSTAGYSAFARADLTQWTDDGSRTWLSSRYGPAECARTGDVSARRVICTVLTSAGWQIERVAKNVAWGNPQNQAWFTVNGKINYCNLIGGRPDRSKVACLELGEQGWGRQSTSPVTDWGLGGNRTWVPSQDGPALCARTDTGSVPGLVCTVRTSSGWKTRRTQDAVDWGNPENRTWLTVNGRISYCTTFGPVASAARVGCIELGHDGWGQQSISSVTDVGDPVQRTWVAGREGPALCARTLAGGARSLVCTSRTGGAWRTDRTTGPVDWGYEQYRAWLSVAGTISYCGIVGDIPDNTRVSCLDLGSSGWGTPAISEVTDWGDPTNRTWLVSADGPALCGRIGDASDQRVACTVRSGATWSLHRSTTPIDWGYGAERSWVLDQGRIAFCNQVGDYSVDQRVAAQELGADGWGDQIVSPTTDWGDNQP